MRRPDGFETKGKSKAASTEMTAHRRRGKLLGRALGPAIDEFGAEVKPLGREAGRLAVRAVRILLKGAGGLVWGFEQVEDWIATSVAPKLARVPEEQRIEPALTIAGPTIDAMKYCGAEPHLRELFASLLATSMDARTAATAHPAFVDMIRQLAPDEAKLITFMARRHASEWPIVDLYRLIRPLRFKSGKETIDFESAPRLIHVFGPYSFIGQSARCNHLPLIPTYLSNLSRLQIIHIYAVKHTDEDVRYLFDEDPVIKREKAEIMALHEESMFEFGACSLTVFGDQFIRACIR